MIRADFLRTMVLAAGSALVGRRATDSLLWLPPEPVIVAPHPSLFERLMEAFYAEEARTSYPAIAFRCSESTLSKILLDMMPFHRLPMPHGRWQIDGRRWIREDLPGEEFVVSSCLQCRGHGVIRVPVMDRYDGGVLATNGYLPDCIYTDPFELRIPCPKCGPWDKVLAERAGTTASRHDAGVCAGSGGRRLSAAPHDARAHRPLGGAVMKLECVGGPLCGERLDVAEHAHFVEIVMPHRITPYVPTTTADTTPTYVDEPRGLYRRENLWFVRKGVVVGMEHILAWEGER